MTSTLTTLIPSAIGLALSPVPIVELILVLFSTRRAVNAAAFVLTLLLLSFAALVVGALGGQAAASDGGTGSAMALVFIVLGVGLLLLGVTNWRNRADTSEPPVLAAISGMGPAAVAFLGLGATWINPKNLVLLLAAGKTVGDASNPWFVGLVFLVVATLPYTAAAGYALFGGPTAQAHLDRIRTWLVERNRLIMGIVCALMGLLLLAKGLGALP